MVAALGVGLAQGGAEVQIAGGFAYRDLEFATMLPNEVLGTMSNQSGRNYKIACFMMKLYGNAERLLKTVDFCISDFANGQTKLFRVSTFTSPGNLQGYRIQFLSGN